MTRVSRDVVGLYESSALEGRIARARGTARESNAHRAAPDALRRQLWPPTGEMMMHAWWQGWDQADRELRG